MVTATSIRSDSVAARSKPTLTPDASAPRNTLCWEDADVLVDALAIEPGDVCLSAASGDCALSMLVPGPARVVVVDTSSSQLACLELEMAAFRALNHPAMLELLGARPSGRRRLLYARAREYLSPSSRAYWDARPTDIDAGVATAGRMEHYFAFLRRFVLPMAQSKRTIRDLLEPRSEASRRAFYDERWMNWRWRWFLRGCLSRPGVARMAGDGDLSSREEGSLADALLARMEHVLVDQDPSQNPYLHWVLEGRYGAALPHALRLENFELIRSRLDRVEIRQATLFEHLEQAGPVAYDRFNLSTIHEHLQPHARQRLMRMVGASGRRGGRAVYWHIVPRRRAAPIEPRLRRIDAVEARGRAAARAFFFGDLVVEEVV